MQPTEQHSLSRDGDDVYFETVGVPDAPVVVLGHGAGGNHAICLALAFISKRNG